MFIVNSPSSRKASHKINAEIMSLNGNRNPHSHPIIPPTPRIIHRPLCLPHPQPDPASRLVPTIPKHVKRTKRPVLRLRRHFYLGFPKRLLEFLNASVGRLICLPGGRVTVSRWLTLVPGICSGERYEPVRGPLVAVDARVQGGTSFVLILASALCIPCQPNDWAVVLYMYGLATKPYRINLCPGTVSMISFSQVEKERKEPSWSLHLRNTRTTSGVFDASSRRGWCNPGRLPRNAVSEACQTVGMWILMLLTQPGTPEDWPCRGEAISVVRASW